MLTAINQNGEIISLLHIHEREEIRARKKNQDFYCPVCRQRLVLKVGEIRIPHFAHIQQTNCSSVTSEPESLQHLLGKKHLYKWIIRSRLPASLEYYIPAIKQRPDLLMKFRNRHYAIEYQCSSISSTQINNRSKGLRGAGIVPFWIIGGLPYQQRKSEFVYLNDFYWSFIQSSSSLPLFLISYQPKTKQFHLLSHIFPLTSKKALAYQTTWYMDQPSDLSFYGYKDPLTHWYSHKKKWLQHQVRYGNIAKHNWIKAIYTSYHHPFLLPSICGIPVPNMEYIKSHPLEWQFYIYLDCLKHVKIGNRISINYIYQRLLIRQEKGDILIRETPLIKEDAWRNAVQSYLDSLIFLEYFCYVENGQYQLIKPIHIPITEELAENMEMEVKIKLERYWKNPYMSQNLSFYDLLQD